MLISPMPSPSGTNRERLFVLRGAKSNRRGGAYDTVGPTPTNRGAMCAEPDPVKQIAEWAKENLSADDLRIRGLLSHNDRSAEFAG